MPVLAGTAEGGRAACARGGYVLRRAGSDPARSCWWAPAARCSSAWVPPRSWPTAGVPARVVSLPVLGTVRAAERRLPGRGLPRRRARARASRRAPPSAGTATPTTPSGIDHFGASAPAPSCMEKFGFTADHVAERARALLAAAVAADTACTPTRSARDTIRTHTKGAVAMTRLQDLYDIRARARGSTTCAATGSRRRAGRAAGDWACGASPPTRRSSPRPSRADTYDEQFAASVADHTVETRTGSWSSPTSSTRSRCCARSTTRATARTGTSRWRCRPPWPTTPPAPS